MSVLAYYVGRANKVVPHVPMTKHATHVPKNNISTPTIYVVNVCRVVFHAKMPAAVKPSLTNSM